MLIRLLLLICTLTLGPKLALATPRIAIIIDDIGYKQSDLNMVKLPFALTYAVLPHTPYGKQAAELAFQQNREIMLHIPMEASAQNALGPGALTQHMSRQQIHNTLQLALADIPHVIGVNNHMGSLFTALTHPMAWTMEYLHEHQLFFVDSLTTPKSTARYYAEHYNVAVLSRDVFLDNVQNEAAIEAQFQQLLDIARRRSSAVAIGHPYPATYQFLQARLPQLAAEGIELVPISALLPGRDQVIGMPDLPPPVFPEQPLPHRCRSRAAC